MGSDWTQGPAKWAAVGALGCASVFGLAWTVMSGSRAAAPIAGPAAAAAPVRPAASGGDEGPLDLPRVEPAAPSPRGGAGAIPLAAPVARRAEAAAHGATRTVNLNTATQAELELLPGIGPALASRILDERRRLGGFGSVDQLDDVKGIGPKLMARLRPLVRVE
jgi:competence protein ComEA